MNDRLLRWWRAVAVTAVAGFLLAWPAVASAHNSLRSTSPGDGSEVSRTPAQIVLTFDEPALALGTEVVVTGPSGPVQSGPPRLVDNTVSQAVQPGAPAGAYAVDWRVTSADGHPITGRFTFTTTSPGSGTPPPPAADPEATPPGAPTRSTWWIPIPLIVAVAAGITAFVVARRRRRSTPPG